MGPGERGMLPEVPICPPGRHEHDRAMEFQPEKGDAMQGTLLNPESRAAQMGIRIMGEQEAYAEMSKRLLQGWAMLNEHCPISGFPLLRKGDVTWSVRCSMEVRPDGSAPAPAPQASADDADEPAPAPAPLAERLRGEMLAEANGSSIAAPTPLPPASIPSAEEISSLLSDLLLRGWRMLEEQCPVTDACPLMMEKSSGRKFSVALGKFIDELDTPSAGNVTLNPVADGAVAVPAQPSPVPTALSSEQISAKLGEMLLRGWCMLEELCPTGDCPLMQERDTGRKYSVALGKFMDGATAEAETEEVQVHVDPGSDGEEEDEEFFSRCFLVVAPLYSTPVVSLAVWSVAYVYVSMHVLPPQLPAATHGADGITGQGCSAGTGRHP